jgi:regulator of PEP synthase PpsR (kinase-PPPase family)
MLGAFLTQFPPGAVTVRSETFVQTPQRAREVLERARNENAAVCHAMVSEALKTLVTRFCRRAQLPCRDLTGGIMEFLIKATGVAPRHDLEALHRLDEAYNRRIGALEFTLAHDDGLGLESLHEADIVLVGISRTSKTPTSIYLAQQGYRVANVALAVEIEPPAQLLAVPPKKVVGLLIDPQQLILIRTRRETDWRMAPTSYGAPAHVAREIAWARRLFNASGWRTLDVTDQAIEETAARIIAIVGPPAASIQSASVAESE